MAAQQVAICGFLGSIISFNRLLVGFKNLAPSNTTDFSMKQIILMKNVITFIQTFFCHFYYFLSFMQTLDMNNMVCKPFDYKKFCKPRKIIQYLSVGVLACFASAMDDLIHLIVSFVRISDDSFFHETGQFLTYFSIRDGIDTFSLVKMILLKMIYTGFIIKLSWDTKKALNESAKMAGESAKHSLYRRLFGFSLLPLCLNLLFIIPEAIAESKSVKNDMIWINCQQNGIFERVDVKMGILASMVTCGSFSYIIAYVALYSNVRRAFGCHQGQ